MTTIKQLSNMRGRRVLITGATGHLGRVIAETLAEMGADLILLDRPESPLVELKLSLTKTWSVDCGIVSCDLESEAERRQALEKIKTDGRGLNCLINNAAFTGASSLEGWVTPFEQQTLEVWRRALEVNLTAAFHLCQAFAPELRAAAGANIVNVTSIYGELGPDWNLYAETNLGNPAAYAASKGGLVQLTRWLATTLAPHVRVNAVSPGGIYRNQPGSFVERYTGKTPLRRMACEDDFRGAVAFLASDLSAYVTGEILRVDGGWTAW